MDLSTDPTVRSHLVGLLLGTENDWPVAFESLVRALGPIPDSHGVVHEIEHRAHHHRAVQPARQAAAAAGHRPPRVLVLRAAGVVEEGLADGRRVPAQQPLHVPVDGEALRLLRDDAPGPEDPRDRPGPLQEPPRERQVRLHGGALQPAVRPRRGRRHRRLSDVHEALRRRRLARGVADRQLRRTCSAPTTTRARCSCTCRPPRTTTCSPARCPSGRRRWSCTSCPTSRCTPATRWTTASSRRRPGASARPSTASSTRSSSGSSTPARCWSSAEPTARPTRSIRSTTPTPARTSPSPRCTTTSRGR